MSLLEKLEAYNPKYQSNGQIRMACPFRDRHADGLTGDGSKSMFLSPDINRYHCFSCRAKGLITKMLTSMFDVPYFEASDMVNSTSIYMAEAKSKEFELDFMWDITPPEPLLDRGFSGAVLNHFSVGTNSDGYVVIPCFDHNNNLKGVQFRKYKYNDRKEEWKKTDEWFDEGFQKSSFIYNYDPTLKEAILVEGPADVWRCVQHGITNVMALMGVSVSEIQLDMLCKIPKWKFGLDSDIAGVNAMVNLYSRMNRLVDEILFIEYTDGKDAGDLNRVQLYKAINSPVTYPEFRLKAGV